MSTEIPDDPTWDVAVVGGSLAGCATAIHFAEKGYRVTVLDKKPLTDQHYKQLCTHFVQPHTVPLLARLGLGHLSEPAHSVTTKAVFVTPGGLVDTPGPGYDPEQPDSYALNLERRVLDPAIREAARQRGVHFLDDTAVEGVTEDDSGWTLDTRDARGTHRLRARLVVAADGRRSRLAGLLGNEAEVRPNERVALFGYFTGIDTRADNRSVFIMNEWDLACTYPLVGGRTELVLFADKARVAEWRGADSRMEEFLKYFDGLAEAPSVADAVPESPCWATATTRASSARPWPGPSRSSATRPCRWTPWPASAADSRCSPPSCWPTPSTAAPWPATTCARASTSTAAGSRRTSSRTPRASAGTPWSARTRPPGCGCSKPSARARS